MSTDWNKMRDAIFKGVTSKAKKTELPAKCCGKCEHFLMSSVSAAGDGWCTKQKEGEANKVVMDNDDASSCSMYSETERIRTATTEFVWDTKFRPQRYFDEK